MVGRITRLIVCQNILSSKQHIMLSDWQQTRLLMCVIHKCIPKHPVASLMLFLKIVSILWLPYSYKVTKGLQNRFQRLKCSSVTDSSNSRLALMNLTELPESGRKRHNLSTQLLLLQNTKVLVPLNKKIYLSRFTPDWDLLTSYVCFYPFSFKILSLNNMLFQEPIVRHVWNFLCVFQG